MGKTPGVPCSPKGIPVVSYGAIMWPETLYHRDGALLYIAYVMRLYLGCTYPSWQVALQSVAIGNALGWLARPLVAEAVPW